jgi:hypothetical protein
MSRASRGHGSRQDGHRRLGWSTLAWAVGTLIAAAGLWLGVMQYRDSQREEQASAREPMAKVCARASDVLDSLFTVYRARLSGLAPEDVAFDALHVDARELSAAANDTDSTELRRAASSVRQQFELVTPVTYRPIAAGNANTPAARALVVGNKDLAAIHARCRRDGFPVNDVPTDLNP